MLASPSEEIFGLSPLSARRFLRHYGRDSEAAASMLVLLGEISAEFEALVLSEGAKKPCISLNALAISGGDVISLGLASGKGVGDLLSALLDAVIADPSLNEREKLISLSHLIMKDMR